MKSIFLWLCLFFGAMQLNAQSYTYFKNDEKVVAFLKEKEAAFLQVMEPQKEYVISQTYKTDYLLSKSTYYLFRTIESFDFGGKTGSQTKINFYVFDAASKIIDQLIIENGQSEYGGCYTEMEMRIDTLLLTEYCEQLGYTYEEGNEEAVPELVRSGETKIKRAMVLQNNGKLLEILPFTKAQIEQAVKVIRQKFAEVNQNYKQYHSVELAGYSSKYGECVANIYTNEHFSYIETSIEGSVQRLMQYFFLENNQLFFYFEVLEKYNAPVTTEYYDAAQTIKEVKRYYFYEQQLIRWLDKQNKEVPFSGDIYSNEKNRIAEDLDEIQ